VLPFGTFFQQAQKTDTAPDISPGYEAPETNDPTQWFAKLFKSDGFLNFSHFGVPELDATIEQAQITQDPAARVQLLQKAQHLISDNAFAVPFSNFNALYVGSSSIDGFKHDLTDLLYDPKFYGVVKKQ
jgi:ABC-type transport system substrate-binding protein